MLARNSDFMRAASSATSFRAPQFLLRPLELGDDPARNGVGVILGFLDQLPVGLGPKQLPLQQTKFPLAGLDAVGGFGRRGVGHWWRLSP